VRYKVEIYFVYAEKETVPHNFSRLRYLYFHSRVSKKIYSKLYKLEPKTRVNVGKKR
jgi:hypothetical protein